MISVAYFVLIVQVGLRWETGTDWHPYLEHFESIKGYNTTSPFLTGFEYGYNLFVWIVKFISKDYSFFLLLHAIIYYFLIVKSFRRYTPYLYLTLMIFYASTMGIMGSNRQLIALAICLYALRYIIEEKPAMFFMFIAIAISFHTTAFLFLIYYFLNREIKPVVLIVIIGSSYIIGKTQLPILLFSLFGNAIGGATATKTLIYLAKAENSLSEYQLSIFGLIKRLLFISVFYYNRKKIGEILPFYNLMLNGYIIGIAFYFLFIDSLLVMVSRGSIFFNIMEALLVSAQLFLFNRKENKVVAITFLLILSFFYFYQSIVTYPDLFLPYKGIFINTDIHRLRI